MPTKKETNTKKMAATKTSSKRKTKKAARKEKLAAAKRTVKSMKPAQKRNKEFPIVGIGESAGGLETNRPAPEKTRDAKDTAH